ncbi:unnamed protein product [Ilex paraguariensis]|uniref:Uncharacterized protein n=1 Tax=Ilex paraguariensis TaxID=185542 RepID=A0ABC8QXM6_9AQUA
MPSKLTHQGSELCFRVRVLWVFRILRLRFKFRELRFFNLQIPFGLCHFVLHCFSIYCVELCEGKQKWGSLVFQTFHCCSVMEG